MAMSKVKRGQQKLLPKTGFSSGCCWKKLLDKTFHKNESSTSLGLQLDEVVFLNLYLTSLEKKMAAIEEVTNLKRSLHSFNENERPISNPALQSGYKTLSNVKKPCHNPPFNIRQVPLPQLEPTQNLIDRNHTDSIIKEILSYENPNFEYERSKWNSLISRSLRSTVRPIEPIREVSGITEIASPTIGCQVALEKVAPEFIVVGKFTVGVQSQEVEIHTAFISAIVTIHDCRPLAKATCSIKYMEAETKTIEIMYNNREWNKSGVIVLKDIDSEFRVQEELIGRVVCFLLGMSEEESAENVPIHL